MAEDGSDVIANSDAEDFAVLARRLHRETSVEETLTLVCRLAASVIPGAGHAGITIIRAGTFSTPASSDSIPYVVDRIQYETGQGPCVEATRNAANMVECPDIANEPRWPEFSERMLAETPVRSMLSYKLFLEEDTLGALNLYADVNEAFSDRARELGGTFAAHAAVAFSAAQADDKIEQLQTALVTSRRIGVAMGILLRSQVVTEDAAFGLLREVSQRTHRKLRDVADEVVFTGELPD